MSELSQPRSRFPAHVRAADHPRGSARERAALREADRAGEERNRARTGLLGLVRERRGAMNPASIERLSRDTRLQPARRNAAPCKAAQP